MVKNFKEIDQKFYKDIYESLNEEYSAYEVNKMLETAAFSEDGDSVQVTYENGNTDVFVKTISLVFSYSKPEYAVKDV